MAEEELVAGGGNMLMRTAICLQDESGEAGGWGENGVQGEHTCIDSDVLAAGENDVKNDGG